MSEEFPQFYYHHLQFDHDDDHDQRQSYIGASSIPYSGGSFLSHTNFQMFDPSYLSFPELFQGSTGQNSYFAMSPEAVSKGKEEPKSEAAMAAACGGETPATPHSSISSASDEYDENSNKGKKGVANETLENDEVDGSRSDAKAKNKRTGKKEKQARFAFMTKSEVDHLEDGYRWRKYGQKAVKNSPYPRSYYRCTTQKCSVKKRVERSFDDPSIVITTYEGQHNHHIPATLRGHVAAAGIFPPSMLSPPLMQPEGPSFSQQLLAQMPHLYSYGGNGGMANVIMNHHQQNLSVPSQQVEQFPDYGLLQDIIPPVFPKQES